MSFPVVPIVDQLLAPTGNLETSGNWLDLGPFGDSPLTIATGGGALASSNGSACGNAWHVPVATATAGMVTMAVAPVSPGYALVGTLSDPAGDLQLAVQVNTNPVQIRLYSNNGSTTVSLASVSSGDSVGWSYDSPSDTLTAWYRLAGTTAWVSKGTFAGGLTQAPTGWLAYIETDDGVTVRLRDFGCYPLPAANPTLNSPILIHGRGAC